MIIYLFPTITFPSLFFCFHLFSYRIKGLSFPNGLCISQSYIVDLCINHLYLCLNHLCKDHRSIWKAVCELLWVMAKIKWSWQQDQYFSTALQTVIMFITMHWDLDPIKRGLVCIWFSVLTCCYSSLSSEMYIRTYCKR